jgi:hypothetical protein
MAPLDSIGRVKTKTIQKEAELKRLFDLIFLNEDWGAIRGNRRGTGGIIPDDWMRKNVLPAIEGNKKALKELSRITGRTIPDLKSAFEKRVPFLEETRVTAAAESFPEDRRLTPEKALEKEQKTKLKRSKRLDITAGKTKYLSGTDAFPFHHIMPIGGEVELTSNDLAILSKKMNSRLAPYNTKLNDIADAISNLYNNQPEGFLKRIDELNNNAEQIVAKATKELPKKFHSYIGFTKLEPVFDENGQIFNLSEKRIGAVREKGIPLSQLTSDQLFKLKNSIKSLSEKEKIAYCSILSRGGLPGDCAAAIDNNPVKAAQVFDEAPVTSKGMEKVKNAASSFLNFAKKGGKYGAIAAGGAAAAGLVKTFMNDDPTTYLSNEDQQKNMLISMVTNPIDDTPQEDPAVLDWQLPTLGAVTAAGMVPGGAELYKARRAIRPDKFIGPMEKGVGPVRAALGLKGVLGKGLAATATPLGLAALEPLHIAGQVAQGDSLTDIAVNPLNYLGPTFAAPLTKEATRFTSPMVSKIMRMGMSPTALRGLSRFGGYGLAASLGIQGLMKFDDWRNKRGWFSEE